MPRPHLAGYGSDRARANTRSDEIEHSGTVLRLLDVRGSCEVEPLIDQLLVADGMHYHIRWFDDPFRPPLEQTTQALGVCFTPERQIVLVTLNGRDWTLPGGTVEQGETLEQTLVREVREEACAQVLECNYLGCQLVEELDGQHASYYQTRFWAKVELEPFVAEHEMTARRLVAPTEFREVLFWGSAPTAGVILERALAIESGIRRNASAVAPEVATGKRKRWSSSVSPGNPFGPD